MNQRKGPGPMVVGLLLLTTLMPPVEASASVQAEADVTQEMAERPSDDPERDRAVLLAREGRFDEALPILRRLHAEEPDHVGLRGDLAAALSWAGDDDEAFLLGADLPFSELPPIIAESIARSARNLQRPDFAADLYRDVLARDPSRIDSQIGFALALLEGGDLDLALARVPILRSRYPDAPDAHLARGHILTAGERWIEAAIEYRAVRDHSSYAPEAAMNEALALREINGDFLAVESLRRHPDAFPAGLRADLIAGRAARWAEWASVAPGRPGPRHRFRAPDRALQELDDAAEEIRSFETPDTSFPLMRLRFDRLVALRERERMEDLLAEVEALESEGGMMPPYAQRLAGDAALALGDPSEAIRRYRAALSGWPDHPETTLGLFYALIEARRFGEGDELLASWIEAQPDQLSIDGVPEPVSNPDLLPIVIGRRLGWAFAGDLARAQEGFEALHARAPMNADIRQELAAVYLWRGWPRRADDLYRRTLAVDPDRVGARVGRIEAALAVDERPRARAVADTLLWLAPENEHVRRSLRSLELDGSWLLSTRAGIGRSTGGEFGTRDEELTTRITSPPIADRLRLFGGSTRTDARFPGGPGAHDRILAGIEFRSRPVTVELGGHGARQGDLDPGVIGTIQLRPGDRLSIELSGDSRTTDAPLRAARVDITGWTVRGRVTHRAHEKRQMGLAVDYMELSDGNRRPSVFLNAEQQVARTPSHRFALLAEGYASTNSRDDAPYFNPSETVSGSGTLLWDWTLFERRDRSYSQRLSLMGGAVAQEGVETRPMTSVALDHRWVMTDRFELTYGLHWGRPVYDGLRERRTAGYIGLLWRVP